METKPNDPVNMGSQERRYGSEDQFVTNDFFDGLTKREQFAAMAMQGILANPTFLSDHQDIDIHLLSVNNADHLIKALNKTQ